MNIDPRTEARFEVEKDASYMKQLARTCALLNQMYQETNDRVYLSSFDRTWKEAMERVESVEFYNMIQSAEKELGY
jgi:hypothetical protein